MTAGSAQDEQTREFTIRNQLTGPYMTATSIFSAAGIFAIPVTGGTRRFLLPGVTIIAVLFISCSCQQRLKKIDAIFRK
jgi:hypothetical protein